MTILTSPDRLSVDHALRARATQVIPGGMYGHMNTGVGLPSSVPQFYARGEDATLWDVDGNEYVDFMCAFGPMVVGYANPVVDQAAAAAQRGGDLLTGPTPALVDLAEKLTETIAHADWTMFAKNGTDATSMAVIIARAATGRSTLLKARSVYHGANAWFTPGQAGITTADRADIVEFTYNDLPSLEQALAENDGAVAAIIVTPHLHEVFVDQQLVDVEFARGARDIADRIGAVLILDEVRTGFRTSLEGSWHAIGVSPDLTAFSKAMANGYALSAVTGIDALRPAASEIFVTGSFWMGSVAMAASVATIDILRDGGIAAIDQAGRELREGVDALAHTHGFEVIQSGPVSMPLFRFADDVDHRQILALTDAAARRGVIIHPVHNMFLSAAHTPAVIRRALERLDDAFAEVAHAR